MKHARDKDSVGEPQKKKQMTLGNFFRTESGAQILPPPHLTQSSRQLPRSDEGLQGDATAFPVAIVRDLEDESVGVRSAVTECAAISALATLGHAAAASRTRSVARTVTNLKC